MGVIENWNKNSMRIRGMASSSAHATMWFLLSGAVFVLMALAGSLLKRLPLSSSLIYLILGFLIGPHAFGLLNISTTSHIHVLERIAEIGVLISLFTAGLKLRAPLRDAVWVPAVRLATLGMVLTTALLTLAGVYLLGLPWWMAVLMAALLSPTDPVLASDVQTRDPNDDDRVRFSLTGEAGLNDGTAFPFVMLALGLGGIHELGAFGWKWISIDVVWATVSGLGIGAGLGMAVARLVVYLRRKHKEALGLDDFLALGLIGLSYGAALTVHGYGFLAVFAAGLALRREERVHSPDNHEGQESQAAAIQMPTSGLQPGTSKPEEAERLATHPEHAPAYMAQAVLEFNEGLERVAEVVLVVITGALLSTGMLSWQSTILTALLLLVIRPLAAYASLIGTTTTWRQRRLIAWFGIRGIGSLYYLFYALSHVQDPAKVQPVVQLVLAVVTASIVMHGITVTPLMQRYEKKQKRMQNT